MKTNKTRKYLLLTGLIVVLIAVGYINFALGNDTGSGDVASKSTEAAVISGALTSDDLAVMSSGTSFSDYKANRQNVRDTEISYLDSIISNKQSDADIVKDAQDQKLEIVRSMETELKVEGLLIASGFADAIVTVQAGSVNVVLKATEISKEQAAKVLEIVEKETGEPAQNIKIIMQK